MRIMGLLYCMSNGTAVRIRNLTKNKDFSGKTGPNNTPKLIADLQRHDCENAIVRVIYPLYHAKEIYIECV